MPPFFVSAGWAQAAVFLTAAGLAVVLCDTLCTVADLVAGLKVVAGLSAVTAGLAGAAGVVWARAGAAKAAVVTAVSKIRRIIGSSCLIRLLWLLYVHQQRRFLGGVAFVPVVAQYALRNIRARA